MSSDSTVETVTEEIRSGIKEGRYVPGQRLVEADLSKVLSVSRGPIREAIRRLASEGIIEIAHNRGAMIRKLTRHDVISLYQVREVMEGLSAKLTAERISNSNHRKSLDKFLAELNDMSRSEDYASFADHNERFHSELVKISENAELSKLISQLQISLFHLQFRLLLDQKVILQSIKDHENILKAILAGDEAAAERAMRRHIRRTREDIEKVPDKFFG
jgi:DNA-binding GntR family transcriptional regulator